MACFTAIDFETAQGPRWSICQIGLIRVKNGEIKHTYSQLIKPPGNKYSRENTLVHGINSSITKNSPIFPDIWKEIKVYIENQLVVAHNIEFDIDCLIKTLTYYNIDIPKFDIDCTFRKTGLSLVDLCQAFNIELENHHNAIQDALACSKVYLRLLNGDTPDLSKIKRMKAKNKIYERPGHERLKGDLLKPNRDKDIANINNPFYGKKVVFTGVLLSMNREEAARIIKKLGADIDTNITAKTNYVIVGIDPGPLKMRKIEMYNNEGSSIQIIKEDEFLNMIKKLA
ncbi:MAG: hypothetical protein GX075_06100 [Firmicutes bacterium]|nr:hypothetical protein [Bacillota bacterium]